MPRRADAGRVEVYAWIECRACWRLCYIVRAPVDGDVLACKCGANLFERGVFFIRESVSQYEMVPTLSKSEASRADIAFLANCGVAGDLEVDRGSGGSGEAGKGGLWG